MQWFAYNGDADGICSMVQWALAKGITGNRIVPTETFVEVEDLAQIHAGIVHPTTRLVPSPAKRRLELIDVDVLRLCCGDGPSCRDSQNK